MTDTETISVADVSAGAGGEDGDPGTPVSLPVVEILTGRGFITGKSGSGKSNTASVVAEKLLSANFPILVVDTDGEYYGLKEQFELLHVGADEECDIQVSAEHAERIATLALEENVPIILDVSGYLDEADRKELLLETARHLFAKEKKLKKPFLMLVEECHEYIPEGGGLDEAGKMLIKIGKRGRKHGLGIVGISQRPADVKKDYITQCDWLVWHRLTWRNDTKVVGRILGGEYADAIEDMDDGEAFLVTDWAESVRRVQFHRKTTFDAGATPGLEDFERPELKSVSGDLVDELRDISEGEERRESELADLRQELERKDRRIRELERELEEARDLRRMADKFSQALLQRSEAPYRGGGGRNLSRPDEAQAALGEYEAGGADANGHGTTADDATAAAASESAGSTAPDPRNGALEGGVSEADPAPGPDRPASESADDAASDPTPAPYPGFESVAVDDPGDVEHPVDTPDGERSRRVVAETLCGLIECLEPVTRRMLAHYRDAGTSDPVAAHVAAGEAADERIAYSRNRTLRRAGLVVHVGRGRYAYAVRDLVREEYADLLDSDRLAETIAAIEGSLPDPDAAVTADATTSTTNSERSGATDARE